MAAARKSSRYGHRNATMILLGYRHGLRASELCDLSWSQVELNTGRLHVKYAPRVSSVAMLFNPAVTTYAEYWLKPFKSTAASFAVKAIAAPVHDTFEIESVVAARAREPNGGLIVMPDAFLFTQRAEVTSLAARYHLPAVYPQRVFAEVGGLLAYGNDRRDHYRRAATYADRLLKGEKASELPVQAPVKFELVINLKTAKALGIDVPPTLLARADEVIE
jgi:putative ABC transport system substrate-binding protein